MNPVKADGSPGNLQGATITISTETSGVAQGVIEPDGRLKITPMSPGVATLVASATVAGLQITGTLTITVSPVGEPTTGIDFTQVESFPL